MPDFRVADTAPEHPKLRAAGLAAFGLWAAAGAYSMRELTDGWVPEYWVHSWPGGKKQAATLVSVRLWFRESSEHSMPGFRFHDWTDYQRTAEQIRAASAAAVTRRAVYSDPELVAAVRGRDMDRCRYCGREVNWRDRRGRGGGTYDLVVPVAHGGATEPSNVVIACRGCNAAKRDRTPQQAGMALRQPPGEQNGTRSDLASDLVRNQIPPITPHPHPHPGSGLVGGGGSGSGRADAEKAPPRCAQHSELPADADVPPCGACKRLRIEAEQRAAGEVFAEMASRADRRAAIDACQICDPNGMRELDDGALVRCTHPALEAIS